MIKTKAISWYHVEENKHSTLYNNHNLHTYDPYYQNETDDKLFIDTDWWASLTPFAQNQIKERVGLDKIEFCHVTVPHPLGKEPKDAKYVTEVYYAYLESFDYNNWYHSGIENGPKNVKLIPLNPIKDVLQTITRKRLVAGGSFSEEDLDDLGDLHKEITEYFEMQKHFSLDSKFNTVSQGKPVFARLSSTSGKNEVAVEPLNNPMDVLHFMTNNRLFLKQEYSVAYKQSYLILMPWIDQLNERYEFRIFVYEGRLTGISTQKWYALFQYSDEEIESIVIAMSDLRFLKDVPYRTLVADVWVSCGATDKDEKPTCHLIECNPFGAHCGAGSSLFDWVSDFDQLHGKNDWAEFKHTSIILQDSASN